MLSEARLGVSSSTSTDAPMLGSYMKVATNLSASSSSSSRCMILGSYRPSSSGFHGHAGRAGFMPTTGTASLSIAARQKIMTSTGSGTCPSRPSLARLLPARK